VEGAVKTILRRIFSLVALGLILASGRPAVAVSTHPLVWPAIRSQTGFSYVLYDDNPIYMANWANSAGCKWLGIAGQVFDFNGRAVLGLYAHLEGGGLTVDAPTGSQPQYGLGGYEIFLADHVMDTTNTYQLQLRNPGGEALSDWYTVPTHADCSKNLIVVNFVHVPLEIRSYLPFMRRSP
jgi:hypothetical protein